MTLNDSDRDFSPCFLPKMNNYSIGHIIRPPYHEKFTFNFAHFNFQNAIVPCWSDISMVNHIIPESWWSMLRGTLYTTNELGWVVRCHGYYVLYIYGYLSGVDFGSLKPGQGTSQYLWYSHPMWCMRKHRVLTIIYRKYFDCWIHFRRGVGTIMKIKNHLKHTSFVTVVTQNQAKFTLPNNGNQWPMSLIVRKYIVC